MNGAREYADLVGSRKYNKLQTVASHHARGKTFHVYILNDAGEQTVEVYGVIGGNPGWTEEYGWLHLGKWVTDFNDLVESLMLEKMEKERINQATTQEADDARKLRLQTLLKEY